VAPFVKVGVLRRVMDEIQEGVDLRVVTRWRPEEIRAGVSDPQILDLLIERPASALFLRNDLHAKYFRADAHAVIGSANLTAAALGWSSAPNLELLEPLVVDQEWIDDFEAFLFSGCVEATPELRDWVLAAAEALPSVPTPEALPEEMVEAESIEPTAAWVPSLRNPDELYDYYVGNADRLTRAARESAHQDLRKLRISPGLSREAFVQYVGVILMQDPLVRRIDEFVVVRRRFGEVRDLIGRITGQSAEEADRSWQTLMRWLVLYLPDRYSADVPRHSELFVRR
jgi:hypothetical protein